MIALRKLHLLFMCLLGTGSLLSACGGTPVTATPQALDVTPSPTPTVTSSPLPLSTPLPGSGDQLILAMTEGGTSHLYFLSPSAPKMTRLTADPWDDISPAVNPDGKRLAFSSNRNGYWDLYLLDLETGGVSRLTDTPAYESEPSWSPDGQWIVYTGYESGNLELYVQSVADPSQPPIKLTNSPAADFSPAWSPGGRQVAFVSNRSGQEDIWLADLDQAGDDRYRNLSDSPLSRESHPAWSPDGNLLAWAAVDSSGVSTIQVIDLRTPATPSRLAGSGSWPIWQNGSGLITAVASVNQWLLNGYSFPGGELNLPLLPLSGTPRGLSWLPGGLPLPLAEPFQQAESAEPPVLYSQSQPERTGIPVGRASLVELEGVQAPYPRLHDAAADSFLALQKRLALETGWDALATLGNAYVPLTTPLDPGMGEDWLYTGRAFVINPLLASAGWIAAVREDQGGVTYWRLYLRTLAQDGSQGEPLQHAPWDFNARYTGDPGFYDQGGEKMDQVPSGYWFDLTALAAEYGWQRLPALPSWRTYVAGARFTEFAFTQGLDWRTAMLELYPPDALLTPTVVIPPTRTPTATPWGYRTPVPTLIPTMRPTYTPRP